jgi:hypothetical protein
MQIVFLRKSNFLERYYYKFDCSSDLSLKQLAYKHTDNPDWELSLHFWSTIDSPSRIVVKLVADPQCIHVSDSGMSN